jgi:hypothetical protein
MQNRGFQRLARKKRHTESNSHLNGLTRIFPPLPPKFPTLKFPTLKFPTLKLLIFLLTKNKDIMQRLKSRKLWATIVGAALLAAGPQFGLTPETTQWVSTIIVGYVLGQSAVDASVNLSAK